MAKPRELSPLGNMRLKQWSNRRRADKPALGLSKALKTLERVILVAETSQCAGCEPILMGAVQPSPATPRLIEACGRHDGSVCKRHQKQYALEFSTKGLAACDADRDQ